MLNNINTMKKQRGFTIVELLIVIVVIAILAAISIVAYTGIQNRGKASAGQSLASQVQKKALSYYTVSSTYPTYAQLTATTSTVPEAQLDDPSAVLDAGTATEIDAAADFDNGNAVGYQACTTGARVYWWDFSASSGNVKTLDVGTVTGC